MYLDECFINNVYKCQNVLCTKQYKRRADFRKHLKLSAHGNLLKDVVVENPINRVSKEESLAHLLLLIHNLWDSYRLCDGDRVFIAIKFAFMHIFTTPHVKYRLWMWRMLVCELSVLSPADAFEYK